MILLLREKSSSLALVDGFVVYYFFIMLTLENLKAFQQDLKIISIELDQLVKIRSEEKLFSNSDDYYNALKACEYYPQDYFKLRLFDYDFCLRFNNKMKKFYIRCDSVKEIDFSRLEFEKLFENKIDVRLGLDRNKTALYFDSNYSFDEVIKIFGLFIQCFVNYYLNQDKLFSYVV